MTTKKELKEAYKQQKPVAGIFQVKDQKNGMTLIDESTNIPAKWNRHRTELRFGSHRNKRLQKDWNDLGEDNFVFSVLSVLEIKEDENLDLNSELKTLREMVEEELTIQADMRY